MLPWVLMWVLALGLFALCKWLTWRNANVAGAARARQAAYLLAWPGMDARAFLDPHPIPSDARPRAGEWFFALAKTSLGIALIWLVVPRIPADLLLARGWVGMAGLLFLFHFGIFHIVSCLWRSRGVNAKSLMNWPILSRNLADFWGRRWNTAFRDLTHGFLFRPLASKFGPGTGLVLGFLASGLVHDLVISVPAGGGYGLPTLYFLLQGAGLLASRSVAVFRSGWTGRAFAAIIVAGPAVGLFHPPFLLNVILPFLGVLGAT